MPGYLVPPTKNPGDVLTSALWNTYIRDNLDFGMVRPIADTIIGGGGAAAIDFTSIPATFAQLMLVLYGRGDTGATLTNLQAQLNNDSTAKYQSQSVSATNTTVTAGETLIGTPTSLYCGAIPGATAGANIFSAQQILIPYYAGSTNKKSIEVTAGFRSVGTSGGGTTVRSSGWWDSVAAINRLTLFPAAGNFVAGTRAVLYGMGGI